MIHQREIAALRKSNPPVSEVGPAHQVGERGQQWIEQEIAKREAVCDQDVQLIADRFQTVMRQCGDRITAAQTRYDEAYRRWQQENKGDNLKGTG